MGRWRRAAAAAAAADVGEDGGEVLVSAAEDDDMLGDGLRGEAAGSLLSELVVAVDDRGCEG